MNYFKQINELYSCLDYKQLSSSAILVYMALLHIANKSGWQEELSIANSTLKERTKLSIGVVQRARDELVKYGLIIYIKGTRDLEAPKYRIIKLYDRHGKEIDNETDNEIGNGIDNETSNEIDTYNKHNITKHNININSKEKKDDLSEHYEILNSSQEDQYVCPKYD